MFYRLKCAIGSFFRKLFTLVLVACTVLFLVTNFTNVKNLKNTFTQISQKNVEYTEQDDEEILDQPQVRQVEYSPNYSDDDQNRLTSLFMQNTGESLPKQRIQQRQTRYNYNTDRNRRYHECTENLSFFDEVFGTIDCK